jgi:hypothetical protein
MNETMDEDDTYTLDEYDDYPEYELSNDCVIEYE